jgi:hypothetical protein
VKRKVFTAAALLSLLLCMATAVLWVHGRGRTAGWFFAPSKPFTIEPPSPNLPSSWCVQWRIIWSNDGCLLVGRRVLDVGPARVTMLAMLLHHGFYSAYSPDPIRWTALPRVYPRPVSKPLRISRGRSIVLLRTKPETYVSFRGLEYLSQEQEFDRWSDGHWGSDIGQKHVRIPLLYLFALFTILPIVWCWRAYRVWRYPRDGCPTCSYNLTGNTSGVCPECGTAVAPKAEAKA